MEGITRRVSGPARRADQSTVRDLSLSKGRDFLTSPCPRGGRREPKVSDGRGATRADEECARFFVAPLQTVVLLCGSSLCLCIAIKRVGRGATSGFAPRPATPLRGLRRPLLGQGEVRTNQPTSAGFRTGLCLARPCRSARGRGRWTADDSGRRGRRDSNAPSGISSASHARQQPPCSN